MKNKSETQILDLGYMGHMGVSKNNGTPKSSILMSFSIINHPFWGTPIFGNTHMIVPGNEGLLLHFPSPLNPKKNYKKFTYFFSKTAGVFGARIGIEAKRTQKLLGRQNF